MAYSRTTLRGSNPRGLVQRLHALLVWRLSGNWLGGIVCAVDYGSRHCQHVVWQASAHVPISHARMKTSISRAHLLQSVRR